MINKLIYFPLFSLLLFLYSCSGSNAPSNSSSGVGILAGRVLLFDSSGTILTDFSGVNVSIDSTTMATTTDSVGNWTITNVPQGQYNVIAAKPGFGAFRWFQQDVIAGGRYDLTTAGLADVSDRCLIDSVHWDTVGGSEYLYILVQTPINSAFAAYCDLDSITPAQNAHLAVTNFIGYGNDPYLSFSLDELRASGALPGQTLYLSVSTVFAPNNNDLGAYSIAYYDPIHHETRYASTGPTSKVMAVKMQ